VRVDEFVVDVRSALAARDDTSLVKDRKVLRDVLLHVAYGLRQLSHRRWAFLEPESRLIRIG